MVRITNKESDSCFFPPHLASLSICSTFQCLFRKRETRNSRKIRFKCILIILSFTAIVLITFSYRAKCKLNSFFFCCACVFKLRTCFFVVNLSKFDCHFPAELRKQIKNRRKKIAKKRRRSASFSFDFVRCECICIIDTAVFVCIGITFAYVIQ